MRTFIEHLKERNYQNRTIGLIENGSWASTAGKVIAGMLEKSKNITMLEKPVKIMSSLSEENLKELDEMAEELMKVNADSLGAVGRAKYDELTGKI